MAGKGLYRFPPSRRDRNLCQGIMQAKRTDKHTVAKRLDREVQKAVEEKGKRFGVNIKILKI